MSRDADVKPILALCSCTTPDAPEDEADTWVTAREMGKALSANYPVRYISGDDPIVFGELSKLKGESGVVLNMMEHSEDSRWPAVLEKLGVAYTGCDALTLMLSTNKPWMKLFAKRAGMRAPSDSNPDYPVIVKPEAEDASVGIFQENVCTSRYY